MKLSPDATSSAHFTLENPLAFLSIKAAANSSDSGTGHERGRRAWAVIEN